MLKVDSCSAGEGILSFFDTGDLELFFSRSLILIFASSNQCKFCTPISRKHLILFSYFHIAQGMLSFT
jgi:hypothetical protein